MTRVNTEVTSAAPLNASFSELIGLGFHQMETMLEAQSALTKQMQDSSASWVKRVEAETALTADLATRLTNARTLTEQAAAWQDWANRRVLLAGEDTKHAMNDVRKLVAAAALVAKGDEEAPKKH